MRLYYDTLQMNSYGYCKTDTLLTKTMKRPPFPIWLEIGYIENQPIYIYIQIQVLDERSTSYCYFIVLHSIGMF